MSTGSGGVVLFDDLGEDRDGLLLLPHLFLQPVTVPAQLVHEEARALGLIDHAGQDRIDVLAGDPGGEHMLDQDDPLHRLRDESAVPRGRALRDQEPLLLVIADGAWADPGPLREIPDAQQLGLEPDISVTFHHGLTQSSTGILNLAPFSFFNAFNYTPPIIGFASNGPKDSLANAESTGEFCWNLVSADFAEQMNASSAEVPGEVDEFALAGLAPAPSRVVSAPHVAQARAVFECRTTQIVPLRTAAGKQTVTHVVFGEVVGVHIAKTLLREGIYQTAAGEPLLRGGGPATYFTIREEDRLEMHRP